MSLLGIVLALKKIVLCLQSHIFIDGKCMANMWYFSLIVGKYMKEGKVCVNLTCFFQIFSFQWLRRLIPLMFTSFCCEDEKVLLTYNVPL